MEKCKDLEMPYSKIDFSQLSIEKVYEYMDCYFNDIITMIEETDFDILAHLTCPLKYIKGKFNIIKKNINFKKVLTIL